MKAILVGNRKLYERFAGVPKTGFTVVTTPKGTPIMYLNCIPMTQLWVVDIKSKIDILGEEFGYVSIDDYLEAL